MKLISKYTAQKKISVIWFVASGIYIVLFLLIAIPKTTIGSTENFEWLINYLSPVLSLITSAFVYSANNRETLELKKIDIFFSNLIIFSSLFYIGFLFVILLITPLSEKKDITFMNHLKQFSLVLGFLQTTLVVLLGIFFVKEEK